MTDLEKALAAGGKPQMTDLDRALAAGGQHVGSPTMIRRPKSETASDEELGIDSGLQQTELTPKERLGNAAGALNSTVDRYTLGAYGAALRAAGAIDRATGTQNGIAERTAQGIDQYRQTNPVLSGLTDAPAYVVEGPATGIAKAIDRVLPRVTNRVAQVARTGLASAGTSGVAGGAESALRGDAPEDVGRTALASAAGGLILGTGTSAAGHTLGKVGEVIANSRGGQARRLIESRGGTVSPLSSGKGEVFDTMDVKGTSDADIGAQAEASSKRGLDMLNEQKRARLREAGGAIGAVSSSPAAGEQRDVSDVVARMRDAIHDLDTAPQTRAALQDIIAQVEAHQPQGFNADVDPYMLSEADINKMRRALDRQARTGVSTDEKLNPLRQAANLTRGMVNEGPYAEANAQYADVSRDTQASRRLLGINERPKTPEETKTAINAVKNKIIRPGQNTVTAGGQSGDLAEFKAKHPDIGAEFERPELLRAKGDIGFHIIPEHGGLTKRLLSGAALHALPVMAAQMTHAPLSTLGSAALTLGILNRNAIAARYLYPLSRFAPVAEQGIESFARRPLALPTFGREDQP